jgi:hypothetical protein
VIIASRAFLNAKRFKVRGIGSGAKETISDCGFEKAEGTGHGAWARSQESESRIQDEHPRLTGMMEYCNNGMPGTNNLRGELF